MPKTQLKPGQHVDPAQARAMAYVGCPNAVIARRLGCTPRHARRLTAHVREPVNGLVGTAHEHHAWRVWLGMTGSYAQVAFRFGVSRQRVQQALSAALASNDEN